MTISTVSAYGNGARSNLLLNAALYGPDGSVVSTATGPGVSLPGLLLPLTGTYYLRVSGTGLPGIFSSYGSRGQWEANVTYVACPSSCGTPLPPELKPLPPPSSPSLSPSSPQPAVLPVAKISTVSLARLTKSTSIYQCSCECSRLVLLVKPRDTALGL